MLVLSEMGSSIDDSLSSKCSFSSSTQLTISHHPPYGTCTFPIHTVRTGHRTYEERSGDAYVYLRWFALVLVLVPK